MSPSPSFRAVAHVDELKSLEKTLLRFYPHSFQMLNIVRLKLEKMYPQELNISLYLYEEEGGAGYEAPTSPFLVSIQIPNVHSHYGVISWSPDAPSAAAMLAFDSLIDWNRLHFLTSVRSSFSPLLKTLLDSHGNTSVHKEGIPGAIYFMDKSKALDFTPPPSAPSIKPLAPSFAPEIVSNWKFAASNSSAAIAASLSSLPSVGIFVEGELASSAILVPIGFLGILHTAEAHRRKGYAELTMLALCKEVAKVGLTPAVEIEATNERSLALMKKIGFTFLCEINRFYFSK